MKVALVYDRVNKWGGAERVLLALHELFPNAPLFTSVYDKKNASWAKDFNVKPSFLQKIPHAVKNHEYYPFMMPLAFEHFSFDDYDLVISLTSEAAKGIITKPNSKHICYCLTPTRYLWSGYDDYLNTPSKKTFAYPFVSYLRKWDKIAAHRPDMFIAASDEVKKRIKKYYGKDSLVIYPPSMLKKIESKKTVKDKGQYFLVVSRFVPYKRIDLAIQACNELKLPLKIVGGGREEERLRQIAGKTIEFVGNLTDEELVSYYKGCKALIFPGFEDFGLVVVEAQQYGKPVIAFRGGGAMETVIDKKTGAFFDKQTKESLIEVLKNFDSFSFKPEASIENAKRFTMNTFKSEFLSLVNRVF